MICKMHSVSCLAVCVVFLVLFHFAFLREALAVQSGASTQQQSQGSNHTGSANNETGSQRLPSNLQPLHYDLVIHPDIYQDNPSNFSFEGRVTIEMKCISPTKTIVLNAKNLNIAQSDIVVSGPAGDLNVVSVALNDQAETLNISLEEELEEDEHYTVQIEYSAPLKDVESGLFYTTYQRGNQTVYLATTSFRYTNARKAFPCMDEPALKANFTIHVIRRSFNLALSNMPVETSRNLDGDKVVDNFETSLLMSTHLVTFIVCDFVNKTRMTNRNVQVEVWAKRETVDKMSLALDYGVQTINFLEEYFEMDFPLPKFSMVHIPSVSEFETVNWGLVVHGFVFPLYDNQSTVIYKMSIALFVANEITEMWFGGLVTPVSRNDFRINTDFIYFIEHVVVHNLHPGDELTYVLVTMMFKAMTVDGSMESSPRIVPGAGLSKSSTASLFKGAFVVQMLYFAIGDDKFRKGLKRYLNTHKYGSASYTDLWNALDEGELDVSIEDFMNTWAQQMNYPLVTVTIEGQNVTLTQERFLDDPNAEDPGKYTSPFGYKWDIPFTFTTSDEKNFNVTSSDIVWMTIDEDKKTFTVPTLSEDSWVLGNVELRGFYKVNYDDNNWRKLTAQLRDDYTVFDPLNRGQILGDIWALASAGLVNQSRALEALEYLDTETEYLPWTRVDDVLEKLRDILFFTDLFPAFEAFMVHTTNPLYRKLGQKATNDLNEAKLQTKVLSLSCSFDGSECTQDANAFMEDWKENPSENPFPYHPRELWYPAVLRQGNRDNWDFMFDLYKDDDPSDEFALERGLCSTNNSEDLNRVFDWVLRDNRTDDFVRLVFYASLNPSNAKLAWNFINNTWDIHHEKYTASRWDFPATIRILGKYFSTQDQLQEFQDFVDRHTDLGNAAEAFSTALESIANNIAWINKNAGIMQKWLQDQGFSV